MLDVLVQARRDRQAALLLMRKLLFRRGLPPRVVITDKLRSHSAAKREIMPGVEHRSHKGLNSRAENSHQPTRSGERVMTRFKGSVALSAEGCVLVRIADMQHQTGGDE